MRTIKDPQTTINIWIGIALASAALVVVMGKPAVIFLLFAIAGLGLAAKSYAPKN
ncbi:hypothetical protein [Corynebacterium uterequi]|uniref:Uncharacterized protein n=1 Tax=Corynebacterium uterequi TaxID=1072256 RepID=A0A0G3HGX6_9CORY|nr:hypothetical protein [Corynebacterium uterequi]AKK10397.1 hypothetical protein CUTER_01910 [Corynebacterium uterequi]